MIRVTGRHAQVIVKRPAKGPLVWRGHRAYSNRIPTLLVANVDLSDSSRAQFESDPLVEFVKWNTEEDDGALGRALATLFTRGEQLK